MFGECVALKDERLVYRACSVAFAKIIGKSSAAEVIGKTDFDLFSGAFAREQMALDSQTIFYAKSDLRALSIDEREDGEGYQQILILRTPIWSDDRKVRGIDIRLVPCQQNSLVSRVQAVDFALMVDEGVHGHLITHDQTILFATDNIAHTLGFANAQALEGHGRLSEIFSTIEPVDQSLYNESGTASAETPTSPMGERSGNVTLRARGMKDSVFKVEARVTRVQWGLSQALLMSFISAKPYSESIVIVKNEKKAIAGSFIAAAPDTAPFFGTASSIELPAANSSTNFNADPLNQDTTRHRQAGMSSKHIDDLRRLRSSEQRFRHYASAAADFFWETDANLTFRELSEGLEKVLGVPREFLIGRTHAQLLDHPGNINNDSHWKNHLQQLEDGLPFRDFEFRWSTGGETRVVRYSGLPIFNSAKEFTGYRGTGCDVTANVKQAETTAYHANHDALTGLYNRRSFENTVTDALESSKRRRESHALCFMDLDSFKIVNDTCGHQAGDELLRQLSQLFDSLARKSDVLARLGGDEFGLLLYKCNVAEALKLANQIRYEVENFQFLWDESRFSVGVSIGLVVVDDRWESTASLFRAADSACYIAKDEGRNRVVVYREGEGNASNRKITTHWVEQINMALEADRMRLACQKIVPLNEQPDGLRFEMLLRLETADGDLVSPQTFLPTAERYGLVSALDERAISMTLKWLFANPALQHTICHVCINLSAYSCTDPGFAARMLKRITESGVDPAKLCFEISETTAIANLARVSEFMAELSSVGCKFCIDDFGSGLSSFSFLRRLPIDFLKIDGLLVKNILEDATDFTMVKAISDISKSMGKRTVAEFIESPGLLDAVRKIGIDFGQGYHIGEPELIS